MKGLILAGVATCWLMGICAAGLRIYRGDREYKVFLGALGTALILYSSMFAILPEDLAFLPGRVVEPASAVDFWNGLIVLLLAFHGFWALAYITCLGPTITILIEMERHHDCGMTKDDVMGIFGGDSAVNTILRRRLPKLVNGGYLMEQAGVYRMLPRGMLAGKVCVRAMKLVGCLKG